MLFKDFARGVGGTSGADDAGTADDAGGGARQTSSRAWAASSQAVSSSSCSARAANLSVIYNFFNRFSCNFLILGNRKFLCRIYEIHKMMFCRFKLFL